MISSSSRRRSLQWNVQQTDFGRLLGNVDMVNMRGCYRTGTSWTNLHRMGLFHRLLIWNFYLLLQALLMKAPHACDCKRLTKFWLYEEESARVKISRVRINSNTNRGKTNCLLFQYELGFWFNLPRDFEVLHLRACRPIMHRCKSNRIDMYSCTGWPRSHRTPRQYAPQTQFKFTLHSAARSTV
jgi:hypothetical protein